MTESRVRSAGAHHKDLGLLITGGWEAKTTTEITTDGINFNAFTPLPVTGNVIPVGGLSDHCMVALDGGGEDGDFFVGGGYSSHGLSEKAYIYRDNQWAEVEEMTKRYSKMFNLEMQSEISWKL